MTPGGDVFSWLSPTLGLWFSVLLERDLQLTQWLSKGRPAQLLDDWIFQCARILTAMKQEVTRAHRNEQWALDDMVYTTVVTEHEHSGSLKKGPDEGVYVHGLFLDGAAWKMSKNKDNRSLFGAKSTFLCASSIARRGNNPIKETKRQFFWSEWCI